MRPLLRCSAALALLLALAPLAHAEEDLASLLPEGTCLYLTMDDVTASRARLEKHALTSLWREPSLQAFLRGPLEELERLMAEARAGLGVSPFGLAEHLKGAASFAVTGVDAKPDGRLVVGLVFLARVGAGGPAVRAWIEKAEEKLGESHRRLEEAVRGVTVVSYHEREERKEREEDESSGSPVTVGPLCWFLHEDLLAVASDPQVLEGVIARLSGGVTGGLAADASYRAAMARIAQGADLRLWIDVAAILAAVKTGVGTEDWAEAEPIVSALGLDGLRGFALATALTDRGLSHRALLLAPRPRRGLLVLLDGPNSALEPPAFTPAAAQSALALAWDVPAIWTEVRRVLAATEPETRDELDAQLEEIKRELGVDVQRDLIGGLGGRITMIDLGEGAAGGEPTVDPGAAGGMSIGMGKVLFAADLKDPARFKTALGTLLAALMPEGSGEPEEVLGAPVWALGGEPHAGPFLTLAGGQIVFGMRRADVETVIRNVGQESAQTLVRSAAWGRALEGLPRQRSFVSFSNVRAQIRELLGAFEGLLEMAEQMPEWLDLSALPVDTIAGYFDLSGGVMVNEEAGLYFESALRIEKPAETTPR
jgi:hypothetical protein